MANWRNPGRNLDTGRAKTSTKHPYAAIEHRVIDSPAYSDLTFSAQAMLVLITRQLTMNNNGHLQATHSYLKGFGFSENTISRCIKELIAHGMIYRSRSGGFHQGAAKYAVTWLSVTNRQGIFLDGFNPCAWREWRPDGKKTAPPNLRTCNRKNGEWTAPTTAKIEAVPTPKIEDIELMPCTGCADDVALAVGLDVDLDSRGRSGARHKKTRATPMICQHANCETITLGREFCGKHQHLASAHTAARQVLNNGDDLAKNG
jgi:hypothetical protein